MSKNFSLYNTPLESGDLHGNSRDYADASGAVKAAVEEAIIDTATEDGLSYHDIANLLAIAGVESGFNPDAAAKVSSSSAAGVFQVTGSTAKDASERLSGTTARSAMVSNALLRNDIDALRQIADEVARGLAYAKTVRGDVYVQTPISSPSGRSVGLKLLGGPMELPSRMMEWRCEKPN